MIFIVKKFMIITFSYNNRLWVLFAPLNPSISVYRRCMRAKDSDCSTMLYLLYTFWVYINSIHKSFAWIFHQLFNVNIRSMAISTNILSLHICSTYAIIFLYYAYGKNQSHDTSYEFHVIKNWEVFIIC